MLKPGKRIPCKPESGHYYAQKDDGSGKQLFYVCGDSACGCGESCVGDTYYEAVNTVRKRKKTKNRR